MSARIPSLDRLRGLVIALMALDHVRDFLQPAGLSPENWDSTTWPFFLMRWVTHFCAPIFVVLAGISVGLYLPKRSKRQGIIFLLTRGLWLMLLEPTWISFSWYFNLDVTHLGVMWAIGGAMVLLATLIWLPRNGVLAVGLGITVGLALFPEWASLKPQGPLVTRITADVLVRPGSFALWGQWFQQSYAILPWAGVMATGYGLAAAVKDPEWRKYSWVLGLVLVLVFVILRTMNGFGDPTPWSAHPRPGTTAMHFLNPSKYPPSLMFQCMTLGGAALALPLFGWMDGLFAKVLQVFGKVPMFFYLLHLPMAHLAGLAYAQGRYGAARIPRDEPLSLALIFGAWILLLVALWPLCKLWGQLKSKHPDWVWLRYL